jgi:hypothetical protein
MTMERKEALMTAKGIVDMLGKFSLISHRANGDVIDNTSYTTLAELQFDVAGLLETAEPGEYCRITFGAEPGFSGHYIDGGPIYLVES